MPIYQFKCAVCGVEREVIQAYTDPPPWCDCDHQRVMVRVPAVSQWQWGRAHAQESPISRAIRRVKARGL